MNRLLSHRIAGLFKSSTNVDAYTTDADARVLVMVNNVFDVHMHFVASRYVKKAAHIIFESKFRSSKWSEVHYWLRFYLFFSCFPLWYHVSTIRCQTVFCAYAYRIAFDTRLRATFSQIYLAYTRDYLKLMRTNPVQTRPASMNTAPNA